MEYKFDDNLFIKDNIHYVHVKMHRIYETGVSL